MADEHIEEQDQGADGADEKTKEQEDQRIPYSRFDEVNKRAKKAEQELQDLRSRLQDFEDRDKTEAERDKARAERAERELQQMMNRVTSLEKGAWVRSAAADLNFHDPEDAVSHLREQLSGFDDARDAKHAVQQLARSKKQRGKETKPPERPASLARVFGGQGQPGQQGQNGGRKTPQQLAAEQELELAKGLSEQLGQFRDKWQEFGGIA